VSNELADELGLQTARRLPKMSTTHKNRFKTTKFEQNTKLTIFTYDRVFVTAPERYFSVGVAPELSRLITLLQLLAMDILVPRSMKNAAKCDT
jgi:hypothetical protein